MKNRATNPANCHAPGGVPTLGRVGTLELPCDPDQTRISADFLDGGNEFCRDLLTITIEHSGVVGVEQMVFNP